MTLRNLVLAVLYIYPLDTLQAFLLPVMMNDIVVCVER